MKKVLGILLAALLLLTAFGTSAAASPVADHSLQFIPPTVTHIEAEWNGEIRLSTWDLSPQFSPANVDVTAHFEDGTYEVLQSWHMEIWTSGNSFWFDVSTRFNAESGVVTVHYFDNLLNAALIEAYPESTWDERRAKMPQATFDFPADYLEEQLAAAVELTLDETVSIPQGQSLFTFTAPSADAVNFRFFSEIGSANVSIFLMQDGVVWRISSSTYLGGSGTRVAMLDGETYLLLVDAAQESDITARASVLEVTGVPNQMPAQSGMFTFTVHTDSEWSITNSSWWVNADYRPDSTVAVHFQANSNNWSRSGSVTLSTDCGEVMHVQFLQAAGASIGDTGGILDFIRDFLNSLPNNLGTGLLIGTGVALLVGLIVALVVPILLASTVFGWIGGVVRWIGDLF